MDYDVLVFIGRFQPFHMGHKAVLDTALRRAKKVALVLGSHNKPRDARNPFTTAERVGMISAVYPQEVAEGRLFFCPQADHAYNMERWIGGIQAHAMRVANTPFTPDPVRIGLIGHSKDHTSFYIKAFPTWDSVEVPNFNNIHATDIRRAFFESSRWDDDYEQFMPPAVAEKMRVFEKTQPFDEMYNEHLFIEAYKKQYERPDAEAIRAAVSDENGALDPWIESKVTTLIHQHTSPYPPIFYTADAVVVQSGHVLLVKRKAMPGKGLWALPGGFVNRTEISKDAAIRELKEETRIALSEEVLRRCITSWQVFEDPHRSLRGRTVTTGYKIELRQEENLPKLKASDDAEDARWVPVSQIARDAMFEDHYDILEMFGLV